MIEVTGLGGGVNDRAVRDERRQLAAGGNSVNAVGIAGIVGGDVETDGGAGMIVRVIDRRAETPQTNSGGVGHDVGGGGGGRPVKISRARAVAGAERVITDPIIV